jgi:hypothetical protein
MSALQFANLFMTHVVRLHELPAELVSDRGTLVYKHLLVMPV